jgi:RNA polymerase sigma-70 factor (ECF subfamily)
LEPADVALVAAVQADRTAFAALYERYQDDLLRYCFYGLGDWDEAADATQQIFANALAALPRFTDRGDSFRRWLFTIAHHEVGDRQRHRGRTSDALLAAEFMVDPSPSPEELAVATDDHRYLRALLGRLSPTCRRVCELRLAGLTDQEIAAVLGMSQGAVRTAQSRAIDQLQQLMGVPTARGGARNA